MSEQPEALRLADELDAVPETGADPDLIQEAAAELRRLHAVNQELLEALKKVLATGGNDKWEAEKDARAAVAKAEVQA
jgi:hypothetical protein